MPTPLLSVAPKLTPDLKRALRRRARAAVEKKTKKKALSSRTWSQNGHWYVTVKVEGGRSWIYMSNGGITDPAQLAHLIQDEIEGRHKSR